MSAFQIVWDSKEVFLWGAFNTLTLVIFSALISIPLGLLGAITLFEVPEPLRRTLAEAFDLLRCIPFLLLAYVVYYGLPELGLRFEPWRAGLVSLALYNTAYFAEIFQSAFQGIKKDDIEAAYAFGFSRILMYRRIIIPQIATISAPLVGNQIITTMRDSALLMIITVEELTFAANFVSANFFSPFLPFAVAVLFYVLMTMLVEMAVRQMAKIRRVHYGS
jgi:polar amino acid transport system permease protein